MAYLFEDRPICVVIPTLNEEDSIGEIVKTFVQEKINVIVVDDNSSDLTCINARINGAWIINNKSRKGIASSLWRGIKTALDLDCFDYIATMDAGNSHDPNQLFSMLELMNTNDLVIGSRFLPFSVYDNTEGKWYRPYASQLAAKLCNLAQHGSKFTDWTSGYRIYRSNLLQELSKYHYNATMHSFQIEMLARANSLGATITEYPITYIAGKSSFNKKVASEAFKIWLEILNHYPPRPKIIVKGDLW